jgi:glyoxylase-like metal-dependent hydrolase (beta-lactamase superfamily II)
MIVEVVESGPFLENAYLVADRKGGEGYLIDPGEGVDRVVASVERHGVRVKAVINTHAHIDHVQGVAEIVRRFGIPFYLHEEDRFWLDRVQDQAAAFGLSMKELPVFDRPLSEGDLFPFGRSSLRVLHVPGHSPGHVGFAGPGMIFSGDLLFAGSIGRTDFEGGSLPALLRSVREKLYPLGDQTIVYPGHGPSTTVGRERRSNPFLQNGFGG